MLKIYSKKILASFLVFLLVVIGFPWSSTLAYFSDQEKSTQNFITLGSLDFSLDSTADFTPAVTPTQASSREATIVNDGTLDFQYKVEIDNFSGDSELCDALDLAVSLEGNPVYIYNGALTDFSLATSTLGAFIFEANLTDSDLALQNKSCSFDFVFTGWQDNLPDETTGFFDIETLSNTVESGSWNGVVLNEILPNPEGDDDQTGIQGEWVEIYNNGNQDVDLTGWYIEDASDSGHRQTISSSNTYNARTVIGQPGSYLEWLVVFMDGAILNNTGDTVSLYDNNDNLIDSYTYGDSSTDADSDSNNTPSGDNQNSSGVETPGNEGKSYARIPDGVGDWVDPIPTPGWTNELDTDTTNTPNTDNTTDTEVETDMSADTYFDLTENTENTENTESTENTGNEDVEEDTTDNPDTYFDLTENTENTENIESTESTENIENTENTGDEDIEEEDTTDNPDTYFDLTENTENTESTENTENIENIENTESTESTGDEAIEEEKEPSLPTSSADELSDGQAEESIEEAPQEESPEEEIVPTPIIEEEEAIIEEQETPEPEAKIQPDPEPEPESTPELDPEIGEE